MVYIFLANGFEEIEALTVVDMLRRAKIDIETVSMEKDLMVTSSHKIKVEADVLFDDMKELETAMYVLPGGIPGTPNLHQNKELERILKRQYNQGGYVAAICAAPSILGDYDMLQGKEAICYPGYEKELKGATISKEGVVKVENVITAKGMGKTIEFAACIIEALDSKEKAQEILNKIMY